MRESFQRVEAATRYRAWLLDLVRPWLGRRVLEVGCGVGNITAHLLDLERVVAIDIERPFVDELHRRIGHPPRLRVEVMDACDEALLALRDEDLDCAVLLNVLEHIDDDIRALENVGNVLRPGSTVVVQVPAHEVLYGASDRALGHRRRYGVAELGATLLAAGLDLEHLVELNALGVPGWFVSGRILRRTMFSERHLAVFEALVPVLRAIEPTTGVPFGLSALAVGRTRR
jgi:SAM-dependent methyltransferase